MLLVNETEGHLSHPRFGTICSSHDEFLDQPVAVDQNKDVLGVDQESDKG